MATYTANILYKHTASGEFRPRLWGDTFDEALVMAYTIGATLDDLQPDSPSFQNFLITLEQQAAAVALGAVMSDWLEPRYQRALRENDFAMVHSIHVTRADAARGARRAA